MNNDVFTNKAVLDVFRYSMHLERGLWSCRYENNAPGDRCTKTFITATEADLFRLSLAQNNTSAVDQTDARTRQELQDFLVLERHLDRLIPARVSLLTGVVRDFHKDGSGLLVSLTYKLPAGEKSLQIRYTDRFEVDRLTREFETARREGFTSRLRVTVTAASSILDRDGNRTLTDPKESGFSRVGPVPRHHNTAHHMSPKDTELRSFL